MSDTTTTIEDDPEGPLHVANIALGKDDLATAENATLEALSRIRKLKQSRSDTPDD